VSRFDSDAVVLRTSTAGLPSIRGFRIFMARSRRWTKASRRVRRSFDYHGMSWTRQVSSSTHVTGVRMGGRVVGAEQDLAESLIVDATGCGSRIPAFLERLGDGRPIASVDAKALRACPAAECAPVQLLQPIDRGSVLSLYRCRGNHVVGRASRRCRWAACVGAKRISLARARSAVRRIRKGQTTEVDGGDIREPHSLHSSGRW
jgi:hypothetical protein